MCQRNDHDPNRRSSTILSNINLKFYDLKLKINSDDIKTENFLESFIEFENDVMKPLILCRLFVLCQVKLMKLKNANKGKMLENKSKFCLRKKLKSPSVDRDEAF